MMKRSTFGVGVQPTGQPKRKRKFQFPRIGVYCSRLAGSVVAFVAMPLLFCSSAFAQTPEAYAIDDVLIEGNRRIDAAAVRAQLTASHGRVSSAQIGTDIKNLYNTGFFDQVTVSVATTSDGRRLLKYSLTEKPVVRKVFVKGNSEISESDLTDVLKFDARRFVDKNKIQLLIRKAISFYQGRGFYDASIDYSTVPVGDNEVDITFNVKEGERYRVREVQIKGASNLDESDMLGGLQVRRYKWWNSWLFGTGRVNQEMLDADKQILRQYLLDHGYLEGTVGEASVEKRDDGLYVGFDLTEGQQFKVGKITASGDLIDKSVPKTLEGVESEPGDVFSATQVRNDIFKITDTFGDRGYAFANVVPNTTLNKANGTVDLDFATAKGNQVRVNKINITGNEKTYDNVIRRELKIEEQDIYSASKIKRSQTLLNRLGYFDEASISNEPTSDPSLVDLNVNVKEATTGSFSAGAGYASGNGALFNTRLSENNLFGTGKRLNLNLDFGTQRSNQVLSYDDPRLNDSKVSFGADLLRTQRQMIGFDRTLAGGALSFGYPLEEILGEWGEDINVNTKYEFNVIDIENVADEAAQLVKDSEGSSNSSSVTPSIVRSTINNPLNPTKGSKQVLSIELAGLGGDQRFYLFEARNQWYYPVIQSGIGEFVLSDRSTFGYGENFRDDPFPLFRRYFPGGINSVRGFKPRRLGPKDENGEEYGGNKELINNLELIFPLLNSAGFKGVVFYDVGQAFDDDQSIRVGDLRQAYGYGIRWASPLGPIRVEFGYPIDREPGEKSPVTMFSFGAPL